MIRLAALALLAAQTGVAHAPTQPTVIKVQVPGRPKVVLAYTVVNPREHRLALKSFGTGVEMRGLPGRISCNGIAVTGGFSKRAGRHLVPEGLLTDAGQTYGEVERWRYGGIFRLSSSSVSITRVADWLRNPQSGGLAMQGKPMLVFGGKVDDGLASDLRQNRVAVGTLDDGKAVLIGAFSPGNGAVTYAEFARLALKTLPNLMTLLNLDGGPSAFMVAPSQNLRLFPGDGTVTTYLCADAR